MDRPVRGSPLEGGTGVSSENLKPLNACKRCFTLFAAPALTSLWANRGVVECVCASPEPVYGLRSVGGQLSPRTIVRARLLSESSQSEV